MRAVRQSGIPLNRVMVGTGAAALADAVRLTRTAVDAGFAGALVIPPFYFKEIGDDAAVEYYRALIRHVNHPDLKLYLYHFPALSGVPFALKTIARLRDEFPETVVGLKDSSGAPGFAAHIAANVPGFDVFPSSEGALLRARINALAGCISASVNVTAPLAGRVWKSGDDAAQTALADVRSALASFPLIPAVRYIVARLRRDDAWLRAVPPLGTLSVEQRRALDERLDSLPGFAEIRSVWSSSLSDQERSQHS
jgi:4-hydroxy-tetrahydrodipicolinate synthase